MLRCVRTNSGNDDFRELVGELDAHLAILDGDEHNFYSQFNKILSINNVVVVYENDKIVGCGALKELASDNMEIKRMFVRPAFRGKGTASLILKELEKWAIELGYKRCILETGKRHQEAIALYKKKWIYIYFKLWPVSACRK